MLEAIRNRSKGPIAKFVLGLIIIPFAFTGVYSYFNAGGANVVATVNDSEIDIREFEQAYRAQQQNWGENFDRFFNTEERIQQFRMNVLQQLIN
ncbi:MAG: SurA N-terminal domain-containing protein, partial [Gammaproteobacteria bacterium]|nr:SurA N-terminal domain-containing protein [Gammaproteobacteria bacterium]